MNTSTVQTASAALGGHYTLRPGVRASVAGQRPVLGGGRLGRLLRGQQGEDIVRTLGNVFTLCAHAHRRTARLSLHAACPQASTVLPVESPVLLQLETARDHLRSMALDWPQRQSTATHRAPDLHWLRDCPLPLMPPAQACSTQEASAALVQLRNWLERLLQQPVQHWLTHHGDSDAFAQWCHSRAHDLPPARCLADWHPLACSLSPHTRSLDLLKTDTSVQSVNLRSIAQAMATDPDFVQRPLWRGQCAETGVWTRLRHPAERDTLPYNAWTRLGARWMELVNITAANPLTDHGQRDTLLDSGALPLGQGQAIAWCEMARGLLLHWVQLDPQGRVEDYRVLAPTEWNFHADGALAHALTALPSHDTAAAWCLAAAYDPCVDCTVLGTSTTTGEIAHA
ncbi:MAG: nickel-dependent hydrogenase large subunit [Burkholderiaceae bacterium]|nr:nickel-dependent hydrogenase large subunit [Burkholderiaceae bacterium]